MSVARELWAARLSRLDAGSEGKWRGHGFGRGSAATGVGRVCWRVWLVRAVQSHRAAAGRRDRAWFRVRTGPAGGPDLPAGEAEARAERPEESAQGGRCGDEEIRCCALRESTHTARAEPRRNAREAGAHDIWLKTYFKTFLFLAHCIIIFGNFAQRASACVCCFGTRVSGRCSLRVRARALVVRTGALGTAARRICGAVQLHVMDAPGKSAKEVTALVRQRLLTFS